MSAMGIGPVAQRPSSVLTLARAEADAGCAVEGDADGVAAAVGFAGGVAAPEPAGDGVMEVAVHAASRIIAKGTESSRRELVMGPTPPFGPWPDDPHPTSPCESP